MGEIPFDGKFVILVIQPNRDPQHNRFVFQKTVKATPHLITSQKTEISYKDALSELIENCIEATVGNSPELRREATVRFDMPHRIICIKDNGRGMTAETMENASNLGGSLRSNECSRLGIHLTGQLGKYGVGKQASYKFSGDAANSKILKTSKTADNGMVNTTFNDQSEFEAKQELFTNLATRDVGAMGTLEEMFVAGLDVPVDFFRESEGGNHFTNVYIGNVCDEFWAEWHGKKEEYWDHFALKYAFYVSGFARRYGLSQLSVAPEVKSTEVDLVIDGVHLKDRTSQIDKLLQCAEMHQIAHETRRIAVTCQRQNQSGTHFTQKWQVQLVCYYFHSEDGQETLPEFLQGRDSPKVYVCWQDLVLPRHPKDTLDFLAYNTRRGGGKKVPKRCFDRVVAILFAAGGKDEHGLNLFEPDPHKLKIHDDDRLMKALTHPDEATHLRYQCDEWYNRYQDGDVQALHYNWLRDECMKRDIEEKYGGEETGRKPIMVTDPLPGQQDWPLFVWKEVRYRGQIYKTGDRVFISTAGQNPNNWTGKSQNAYFGTIVEFRTEDHNDPHTGDVILNEMVYPNIGFKKEIKFKTNCIKWKLPDSMFDHDGVIKKHHRTTEDAEDVKNAEFWKKHGDKRIEMFTPHSIHWDKKPPARLKMKERYEVELVLKTSKGTIIKKDQLLPGVKLLLNFYHVSNSGDSQYGTDKATFDQSGRFKFSNNNLQDPGLHKLVVEVDTASLRHRGEEKPYAAFYRAKGQNPKIQSEPQLVEVEAAEPASLQAVWWPKLAPTKSALDCVQSGGGQHEEKVQCRCGGMLAMKYELRITALDIEGNETDETRIEIDRAKGGYFQIESDPPLTEGSWSYKEIVHNTSLAEGDYGSFTVRGLEAPIKSPEEYDLNVKWVPSAAMSSNTTYLDTYPERIEGTKAITHFRVVGDRRKRFASLEMVQDYADEHMKAIPLWANVTGEGNSRLELKLEVRSGSIAEIRWEYADKELKQEFHPGKLPVKLDANVFDDYGNKFQYLDGNTTDLGVVLAAECKGVELVSESSPLEYKVKRGIINMKNAVKIQEMFGMADGCLKLEVTDHNDDGSIMGSIQSTPLSFQVVSRQLRLGLVTGGHSLECKEGEWTLRMGKNEIVQLSLEILSGDNQVDTSVTKNYSEVQCEWDSQQQAVFSKGKTSLPALRASKDGKYEIRFANLSCRLAVKIEVGKPEQLQILTRSPLREIHIGSEPVDIEFSLLDRQGVVITGVPDTLAEDLQVSLSVQSSDDTLRLSESCKSSFEGASRTLKKTLSMLRSYKGAFNFGDMFFVGAVPRNSKAVGIELVLHQSATALGPPQRILVELLPDRPQKLSMELDGSSKVSNGDAFPNIFVTAEDCYGNEVPASILDSVELKGAEAEIHGRRIWNGGARIEFRGLRVQTTQIAEAHIALSVHWKKDPTIKGTCSATIVPCRGPVKLWSDVQASGQVELVASQQTSLRVRVLNGMDEALEFKADSLRIKSVQGQNARKFGSATVCAEDNTMFEFGEILERKYAKPGIYQCRIELFQKHGAKVPPIDFKVIRRPGPCHHYLYKWHGARHFEAGESHNLTLIACDLKQLETTRHPKELDLVLDRKSASMNMTVAQLRDDGESVLVSQTSANSGMWRIAFPVTGPSVRIQLVWSDAEGPQGTANRPQQTNEPQLLLDSGRRRAGTTDHIPFQLIEEREWHALTMNL
jgi:hypothetical protein